MRFFFAASLSLFLLAGAGSLHAEPSGSSVLPAATDQLRGEDWLKLSREQKERFAQVAIGGLERQGAYITNPFSFYVEKMDAILSSERSFLGQYLDNLFVFTVYDNEPQTRSVIDRIRAESRNDSGSMGS